jgi:hypothetical protein
MDERREKGLCFNCENKYSKGHKCGEKKLFYIDCEEEEDQELEPSQDLDLEDTTPTENIRYEIQRGHITQTTQNLDSLSALVLILTKDEFS